ncbi:hypothetical protein ACOJBM_35530 [Rhizobium beringeri]
MPNIKIYMDQGLPEHTQVGVRENLAPLREIVCRTLKVESSACQLAILLAYGLADQPVVNIEVAILPKTGPHPAGAFRPCGENPEIDRKCRKWASCRAVVCSRPDHVHLTEIVGTTMLSKSARPAPDPMRGPWITALAFSCHESRIEGPCVPRLFSQGGGKGGDRRFQHSLTPSPLEQFLRPRRTGQV